MHLIRLMMTAQQRKADRQILWALRRQVHQDSFAIELERRLLGQ